MFKRFSYAILGILVTFRLLAEETFAISLQDFRTEVFRPENLPIGETGNVPAEVKILDIMNALINLILYASGAIAVLMLVYAGIRLITATGSDEQRDQAIKIVRWSLTGLFVIILAFAAVNSVIGLLYSATA